MFGENSKYTTLINNNENFNLQIELNKAIQNLHADINPYTQENIIEENIIPADPKVRNFTYTFIDEKLYYRENSSMIRIDESEKNKDRIRGLDSIRKITRDIIDIQSNGCTREQLKEYQNKLNSE